MINIINIILYYIYFHLVDGNVKSTRRSFNIFWVNNDLGDLRIGNLNKRWTDYLR